MNEINIIQIDYLISNFYKSSEKCNIIIQKRHEKLFRKGLCKLKQLDSNEFNEVEINLTKREL